MTKLAVGCSFTHGAPWPEIIWPGEKILNLGRSGAGNRYIAKTCIEELSFNQSIDEVFLLFTDFSRTDLEFPKKGYEMVSKDGKDHAYTLRERSAWVHSGADVFKFKPKRVNYFHPIFDKFIALQYLDRTNEYMINSNFLEIISTINFLDNMKIKYNWSMIIDPRDPDTHDVFGTIPVPKTHTLWKSVNMANFVEPTPFKWCLKKDLISDDEFHPSIDGYIKWGEQIKKAINNRTV
jgi:hypothetical protein